LQALRDETVELAVMNYVSAGYYQKTMNDDTSRPALRVVDVLKFSIPVNILTHSITVTPSSSNTYCFLRELEEGLKNGLMKERRNVQVGFLKLFSAI
jgi:hypothetical protein